jgi:hypothetical protein
VLVIVLVIVLVFMLTLIGTFYVTGCHVCNCHLAHHFSGFNVTVLCDRHQISINREQRLILGVCWACAGRVLSACWVCAGCLLGGCCYVCAKRPHCFSSLTERVCHTPNASAVSAYYPCNMPQLCSHTPHSVSCDEAVDSPGSSAV